MWFERRFIYEYIFFYFPPFERQALVFEVTQLQRLKLCVGGCTCRKKKGGGGPDFAKYIGPTITVYEKKWVITHGKEILDMRMKPNRTSIYTMYLLYE